MAADMTSALDAFCKESGISKDEANDILTSVFHFLAYFVDKESYPTSIPSNFNYLSVQNDEFFRKLGRQNIIAAKSLLASMLGMLKNSHADICELISHVKNSGVDELALQSSVGTELKMIWRNVQEDFQRQRYSEIQALNRAPVCDFEATYCPACDSRPCECSDPQWHLDL